MEIVPLGPGFAAELRGVTIHDVAASEAAYAAVRAAFEEHSVLVLRDQDSPMKRSLPSRGASARSRLPR
jgi:alpha-ketoglutarate-dependent 2,4-dichlorophenoxyacetate dioxygenase